MNQHL